MKEGDDNIMVEILEYNYKILSLARQKTRGGGLLILFKPCYSVKLITPESDWNFN